MRAQLVVALLLAVMPVAARGKQQTVYMFAYGSCLTDSVAYLSAVELVKDASIDSKSNFLNDRLAYSNAFKHYLDAKFGGTHMAALFFNVKRDKLEKTFLKIRRNVQKDKQLRLVEIPISDFRLSSVEKQQNAPTANQ